MSDSVDATLPWLTKALHDLETARLVSSREDLLETAIYHCQQAAEKAVKGFLVFHGIAFQKTHDIAELLDNASAIDPSLVQLDEDALMLNPLATKFRYPSNAWDDQPTAGEFAAALAACQRIYDFILSVLPQETHPG